MALEINTKELPRYCLLRGREIECLECYETGMTAEGILPEQFHPKGLEMTEENMQRCLACEYHIK